jgi:hypothetical protein
MHYLEPLMQQWGAERIRTAIQALYIGNGDEPGDPPISVVNASVNDRDLWERVTDEDRDHLYLACLETQYDTADIMQALYNVIEPTGGELPITHQ